MFKKATLLALLAVPTAAAIAQERPRYAPLAERAEVPFELGSANMPAAANHDLARILVWHRQNPTGFVVLDSYASGERDRATRLAMHRAEAVRDQLIVLGVDPDRLVALAHVDELRVDPKVSVFTTHLDRVAILDARRDAVAVMLGRGSFETWQFNTGGREWVTRR